MGFLSSLFRGTPIDVPALEAAGDARRLVIALESKEAEIRDQASGALVRLGARAVDDIIAHGARETRRRGDKVGSLYPMMAASGPFFLLGAFRREGSAVTVQASSVMYVPSPDEAAARQAMAQGEVHLLAPGRGDERDIRWRLVDTLAGIGGAAIPPLLSILDRSMAGQEDAGIASWALVEIGEPAVKPLLREVAAFSANQGGFALKSVPFATLALILRRSQNPSVLDRLGELLDDTSGSSVALDAQLVAHLAHLVGETAEKELSQRLFSRQHET